MIDILIIIIIFSLIFWGLNLTPMVRSTKELQKINKILEDFNNDKDVLKAKSQIEKYDWKYHLDKIDFIKKVIATY